MPPRWQPSLEDYIDLAAYLLGADRAAVAALPRITLAESAPFASFGGTEAYPTLVEQAAVLQHLAKNHPLPDANKRAAFRGARRNWANCTVSRDVVSSSSSDVTTEIVVSPVRVRVLAIAGGVRNWGLVGSGPGVALRTDLQRRARG